MKINIKTVFVFFRLFFGVEKSTKEKFSYALQILFVSLLGGLAACTVGEDKPQGGNPNRVNLYAQDTIFQKILQAQDKRNFENLYRFWQEPLIKQEATYRKAIATAFASFADSSQVDSLFVYLGDSSDLVRAEVAFALGQVGENEAESRLIYSFQIETDSKVRRNLLEAIGKSSSGAGLEFLTQFDATDDLLAEGQALGIYRAAVWKGEISKAAIDKMAFFLQQSLQNQKVRKEENPTLPELLAADYFGRFRTKIFALSQERHQELLAQVAQKSRYVFLRARATAALSAYPNEVAKQDLFAILNQEKEDSQVLLTALQALAAFETSDYAQKNVLKFLEKSDSYTLWVQIQAAQYVQKKPLPSQKEVYQGFLKDPKLPFLAKTYLYAALLQIADKKEKTLLLEEIKSLYQEEKYSLTEKALLLQALETETQAVAFLKTQASDRKLPANLQTAALQTLLVLQKNKGEAAFKKEEFVLFLKQMIELGDIGVAALAAEALQDSELAAEKYLKDYTFLKIAMQELEMPKEVETYQALQNLYEKLSGRKLPAYTEVPTQIIDFQDFTSIKPKQEVRIKTEKGEVVVFLFTEEAPLSVLNFLKLIKEGYYKDKVFHRIVPNFVVQAGCPRADGYGNTSYTIRSELTTLSYMQAGYLGMASAGRDTEGGQWFITLAPAPHLDGRYTIFGKVKSGLEILQKLEVGDKIIDITLEE
ncbi:peptidylprolyl isomerase [Hugenholtzia roseola]|uniref:peptidylprolyl isomerase n=1 Tax=Hugenholtzia roseola TaxID=1002 RepID=UPI00137664E1|nr:peptidylprolyl isomerase [Hugenholtzia roseola]